MGTSQGFHRYFWGSILTFAYFFHILELSSIFCPFFIELGVGLVVTCQRFEWCFGGSFLTFAYFFSYFRNIKPFLHFCYRTIIWSSGYQTRLSLVFWGSILTFAYFFFHIFNYHCLFCSSEKRSKLVPWLPTEALIEILGVQFLSATYFFSSGSFYFFFI